MAEQQKHVLVSVGAAQALINYLKQRPYAEVFQLMDLLLKAPTAEIASRVEPEPEQIS